MNPINPYEQDRTYQNAAGFLAALAMALLIGCALIPLVMP